MHVNFLWAVKFQMNSFLFLKLTNLSEFHYLSMGEDQSLNLEEAFKALEKHGYVLKEQMSKGGFGSCYRVMSIKYKETFVCKITTDVKSFIREVSILRKADHPNIVRCYDYFQEGHYYVIIMEDCENGNMLNNITKNGPLMCKQFVTFANQLSDALSFLHHHHIVHFDIKPANIFLDKYNRVKLGDFGLSEEFKPGIKCLTFRGTQSYAAPEVIRRIPYDPYKADIYSLGLTLYFFITGKHVFKSYHSIQSFMETGEIELSPSLPKILSDFLAECMSLAPSSRPDIDDVKKYFMQRTQENFSFLLTSKSYSMLRAMPRIICPLVAHRSRISPLGKSDISH